MVQDYNYRILEKLNRIFLLGLRSGDGWVRIHVVIVSSLALTLLVFTLFFSLVIHLTISYTATSLGVIFPKIFKENCCMVQYFNSWILFTLFPLYNTVTDF